MKPIVTLLAAVVVAAPLIAEEKKPAEQPKPAPVATAPAPAPAPVVDSPMVAAAKSAKKSGKKVIVITNDNLTKEGSGNAHITTAKTSRPIVVPPEDPLIAQQREKDAQEKANKAHEARVAERNAKEKAAADQKIGSVAARQEAEGPYGDDPAANEKILEELAKKQQQEKTPQPPI